MSDTKTRVTSAIVILPVIIYLFFAGGIQWGILVAVAAAIGTYEVYGMCRARGYRPASVIGIAVSFGFCLALAFKNAALAVCILFIGSMAAAAFDLTRNDPQDSLANMGASLLGIFYVGGLLSHAILIRDYIGGNALGIFYIFVAIGGSMLCDTGAYFTGRAYGKNKLIPKISPGKTVQGTLGGIASGTIGVLLISLVGRIFVKVPLGIFEALLLGFLISVGGVVGDLIESSMKRDAKVKDSGSIIPGHGGLMDRLDALLWAIPITYYFALWANK